MPGIELSTNLIYIVDLIDALRLFATYRYWSIDTNIKYAVL